MSDMISFENRFAHELRSYAAANAPTPERDAVVRAVAAGVASRRIAPWRLRWPVLQRPTLAQTALVGVIVLAVAIGFGIWGGGRNQVVPPGVTPPASEPTQSPPATPIVVVGPTGVGQGWPAGLRPEPTAQPVIVGTTTEDAEGDEGGAGQPFVDIVDILEGTRFGRIPFLLSAAIPSPVPDPVTDLRIAYGAVFDVDGDGVGDVRAGMENAGAEGEELPWTTWVTDLHTGDSTACQCDLLSSGEYSIETFYPLPGEANGQLSLTGGAAANARYYIWASTARGDEVLATDYAPDAGWLELGDPNAIPERVNSDHPGPLRTEPTGGAPIVPGPRPGDYTDPVGDAAPTEFDLADITDVQLREGCWWTLTTEACVYFNLVGQMTHPLPDPSVQWLGYGLVVDTDGDGIGDIQYGMDNVGNDRVQMWRTDLATGVTEAARPGSGEDAVGSGEHAVMYEMYPHQDLEGGLDARMFIDRDPQQLFRFYVWASVIDAQGNVSTDFAPDIDWMTFRPRL